MYTFHLTSTPPHPLLNSVTDVVALQVSANPTQSPTSLHASLIVSSLPMQFVNSDKKTNASVKVKRMNLKEFQTDNETNRHHKLYLLEVTRPDILHENKVNLDGIG